MKYSGFLKNTQYKILFVAATRFELMPLLQAISPFEQHGGSLDFFLYKAQKIFFLQTGIGMVATAYSLGRILEKLQPDIVINAGICGAYKRTVDLGVTFNVVQDEFADFGIDDNGRFDTFFDAGLESPDKFPFQNGKLSASDFQKLKSKTLDMLPRAKGVTVNTVSGNQPEIDKIVDKFDPDVESMEGAAVFFACKNLNVPVIQIRSVSNYVESRNRESWDLKLAISNLNEILLKLIDDI